MLNDDNQLVATWADGETWVIPDRIRGHDQAKKKSGDTVLYERAASDSEVKLQLHLVTNGESKFLSLFHWPDGSRKQVAQLKPPLKALDRAAEFMKIQAKKYANEEINKVQLEVAKKVFLDEVRKEDAEPSSEPIMKRPAAATTPSSETAPPPTDGARDSGGGRDVDEANPNEATGGDAADSQQQSPKRRRMSKSSPVSTPPRPAAKEVTTVEKTQIVKLIIEGGSDGGVTSAASTAASAPASLTAASAPAVTAPAAPPLPPMGSLFARGRGDQPTYSSRDYFQKCIAAAEAGGAALAQRQRVLPPMQGPPSTSIFDSMF